MLSVQSNQLNLLCLLVFVLHGGGIVTCVKIPNVTVTAWDGNVAYFAVSRETIAAKLTELKTQSSGCAAEGLTLPSNPLLPSLIRPDQHLVAIAVGRLTAKTMDDTIPVCLEEEYFTVTDTVQFFIPFLTGEDPCAVPEYKLALGSYVSTPKPFIQPNPMIPTENVDSVLVTSRRVYVGNGSESFSMFYPQSRECVNINNITLQEYDSFIEELTLSFQKGPDYPNCEEPVFADLGLCTNPLSCASCQYWSHGKVDKCFVPAVRLGVVTTKFKEIGCLTGIEEPSVLSMDMRGIFGMGIDTSCM